MDIDTSPIPIIEALNTSSYEQYSSISPLEEDQEDEESSSSWTNESEDNSGNLDHRGDVIYNNSTLIPIRQLSKTNSGLLVDLATKTVTNKLNGFVIDYSDWDFTSLWAKKAALQRNPRAFKKIEPLKIAKIIALISNTGLQHFAASMLNENWPYIDKNYIQTMPKLEEWLNFAQDCFSDTLEGEVIRRAFVGVKVPVFFQGIQCGEETKYSDSLALAVLKKRRQEYREGKTEGAAKESGGVLVVNQTSNSNDEWERLTE